MTRVVGTAGHIDHGKTTLLRALTGIDADRLPEEKARGLTIDVGYARLVTAAGDRLDFVDVPGHDRLVGNMLVGAGEVDACLLVVAADDGPRAQTLEHLALLDALALREGIAVVTKADLVDAGRLSDVEASVRDLLAGTTLHGVPVRSVSASTSAGLGALAGELAVIASRPARPDVTAGAARVAIDRAFSVRGRGTVVTGTARGAPVVVGQHMDVVPGDDEVRVRAIEVHDHGVEVGPSGGRVALLLGGEGVDTLTRGQVLVASGGSVHDPFAPVATRRLLVALAAPLDRSSDRGEQVWPPARDTAARLHIGTDQVGALVIGRGHHVTRLDDGAWTVVVKLEREVAARVGDRIVLRRPPPAGLLGGGLVIDATPASARARRRQTPQRIARLVDAVGQGDRVAMAAALLEVHGVARVPGPGGAGSVRVAEDVRDAVSRAVEAAVAAHHAADPRTPGMSLTDVRSLAGMTFRHATGGAPVDVAEGVDAIIAMLVAAGTLRRDGDVLAVAGHRPAAPDPARADAMDRLVAALDVEAPPALREAAAAAGCPADAIRELEREDRIVLVEDDLAWARPAWERLRDLALRLARTGPLTPATLRDESGTSRKYVMALLEDFGRRGILTRTAAGHVPGPRA